VPRGEASELLRDGGEGRVGRDVGIHGYRVGGKESRI
jgi:hypothetical protein